MPRVGKKRKINILLATDHAGYDGNVAGVGRYLLNVLPRIDRQRFNLELIVLREAASMERELKDTGVRLLSLQRSKFDPFTLRCFTNAISRQRTDVLHLHQYASSNFGRLAGRMMDVPTIVHVHGPDLPYPPHQWLADRLLARCTDLCIAVSDAVKNDISRSRAIKSSNIVTLPNGVALQDFQPVPVATRTAMRRRWGVSDDALLVGTVTRLHEVKGNRYLLEAATAVLRAFPQARFVFVGDGPLLGELQKLASCLGISGKVIFPGYEDRISEALSTFDVKVIASTGEGNPQAMLEAMAMGKAIVATAVGGVPEVIRDGFSGLLVPPANPGALADKVIQLLRNEQERDRLGREARRQSLNYSLDAHVDRLESIYEKMFLKRESEIRSR